MEYARAGRTMMKKPLVIFGTGEIASLALFYFTHDSEYEVMAFTVEDEFVANAEYNNLPLVPFSKITNEFPPSEVAMHVALSYMQFNQLREKKYHQAKAAGYQLASYICSKSVTWPDLIHGDNCFILENQTIQPTVQIGNNVVVWSGNHLGHGSIFDDHTYLASHVVVSGHCKIGKRCFLGVNITIKDFITIGDNCFITMGALITKDLEAGTVVLGSRSTILEPESTAANKIIKSYFKL